MVLQIFLIPKECKYDIIKKIAVEQMNWKALLPAELVNRKQTISFKEGEDNLGDGVENTQNEKTNRQG